MSDPLFSIVVPTRNRPGTLIHCLEALALLQGDFEVVVADNCSTAETRAVVDRFAGRMRLRYSRCDAPLAMHDNFERALDLCKGRYLTYVGDDDALTLDALSIAQSIVTKVDCPVLYWRPHLYWWPNAHFEWKRNLLYVTFAAAHAERVESAAIIKSFFESQALPFAFEQLPSIYCAFAQRDVIDKLRSRLGRYFSDPLPDIFSGVANCMAAGALYRIQRPLSVRGLSGHSIGVGLRKKSHDGSRGKDFVELLKQPLNEPELIDSVTLSVLCASVRLRAIKLWPELNRFRVDISQVIRGMLTELNEDVELYEEHVGSIRALARKYGIADAAITIPPKRETPIGRQKGLMNGGSNAPHLLVIDGDLAGISNVCQAAKLVRAVLPEVA